MRKIYFHFLYYSRWPRWLIELVTSKPSDVGARVRISAQSHKLLGFSLTLCPTSGSWVHEFDFTIDEGKERLNPSRDKKIID